ncbi:MAG: hypothetical protein ACREOS_13865, partial [Candidatus Dormibacteraceae bacterium]
MRDVEQTILVMGLVIGEENKVHALQVIRALWMKHALLWAIEEGDVAGLEHPHVGVRPGRRLGHCSSFISTWGEDDPAGPAVARRPVLAA